MERRDQLEEDKENYKYVAVSERFPVGPQAGEGNYDTVSKRGFLKAENPESAMDQAITSFEEEHGREYALESVVLYNPFTGDKMAEYMSTKKATVARQLPEAEILHRERGLILIYSEVNAKETQKS